MDYRNHIDEQLKQIAAKTPITISSKDGIVQLSTPEGGVTGSGDTIFEASDMFVTAFQASL